MARNKVCLANAIKNPLGSQLRAYRLAIKFPIGNALKHPLGAQASLHYVTLKMNSEFGIRKSELIGLSAYGGNNYSLCER